MAFAACLAGSASAVTGSDFQPGRIIDDQVFNDANSMSPAQIEAFLRNEVPTCDTAGNQPYYGTYKGVTYNGNVLRKNLDPAYPAPYTCLPQYLEDTHVANSGVLNSGGNNIT